MTKREFKFPMSIRERIMGIAYIPIHGVALPLAILVLTRKVLVPNGVVLDSLTTNLIVYALGFAFCLAAMFRYLRQSFFDIFDSKGFVKNFIVSFFLYYVMAYVVSAVLTQIVGAESLVNPNSETINTMIKQNKNLMIVEAVLFAPLLEECIFRGALFGTIRKKSRIAAYVVMIVAFSFYHLWTPFLFDYDWRLWAYLAQYVPAGFVLGMLYEKTGTIWGPIALHAVINAIAVHINFNL